MAKPKEKTNNRITHCPVCNNRAIGYLGKDRCFCADCCIEFEIKIYALNSNGVALRYDMRRNQYV